MAGVGLRGEWAGRVEPLQPANGLPAAALPGVLKVQGNSPWEYRQSSSSLTRRTAKRSNRRQVPKIPAVLLIWCLLFIFMAGLSQRGLDIRWGRVEKCLPIRLLAKTC